ncbi:CGGC domain-containing protein [Chloroflexota bacterium]
MKIGIIRCDEHSNECAGFNCFPAMRDKTGQFTEYEAIELIGFDSCGGCSRNKTDKIVTRALRLKEKGAEVIHLGNCLVSACPFKDIFNEALKEKVGLAIIENTH